MITESTGITCIPNDGNDRCLRTKNVSSKDGYVQITGLCGREKYAHARWQYKYDSKINEDVAKGTIPTYNTDVHKDGKGFCENLKMRTRVEVKPPMLMAINQSFCAGGTGKNVVTRVGVSCKQSPKTRLCSTRRVKRSSWWTLQKVDNMDTVAENFHCLHKVWGRGMMTLQTTVFIRITFGSTIATGLSIWSCSFRVIWPPRVA